MFISYILYFLHSRKLWMRENWNGVNGKSWKKPKWDIIMSWEIGWYYMFLIWFGWTYRSCLPYIIWQMQTIMTFLYLIWGSDYQIEMNEWWMVYIIISGLWKFMNVDIRNNFNIIHSNQSSISCYIIFIFRAN